jgi:hypothetical protein
VFHWIQTQQTSLTNSLGKKYSTVWCTRMIDVVTPWGIRKSQIAFAKANYLMGKELSEATRSSLKTPARAMDLLLWKY